MKDQHTLIAGYVDLPQDHIDLINHVKKVEANMGDLLRAIETGLRDVDPEAVRWVALSRTYMETGFMFAIKAVARPTNGLGRRNPVDAPAPAQQERAQADVAGGPALPAGDAPSEAPSPAAGGPPRGQHDA